MGSKRRDSGENNMSNTFFDYRQAVGHQISSGTGTIRLPATSSNARPPIRHVNRSDFMNSNRGEPEGGTKKSKHGKSKKRKYASQPRGATKKQKHREPLPLMDLPMTRIKESVPRMTYYNNSRDPDQVNGLPREINGA